MPKPADFFSLSEKIPATESDKDVLLAAGAVALEGLSQALMREGVALGPLILSIGGKNTQLTVSDLVAAMRGVLNQPEEISRAIH